MRGPGRPSHPRRRRSDRPHPATAYRLFLLFSTLDATILLFAVATIWRHYT